MMMPSTGYDLTSPLTDIINTCLTEGVYPQLWKYKYISPVPKGFEGSQEDILHI
jgi:hypothetical protein